MASGSSSLEIPSDADVDQLAGYASLLAAAAGVGYAVSFVVAKSDLFSAIFLFGGSALSLFVLLTVYGRLRPVQPTLARWALVFAVAGAVGGAIHGAYDLSNALHPEAALTGYPNPTDPRGVLTFGASGIALLIGGYLAGREPSLPSWARWLAYLTGFALIVTYIGRLVVLDANSPFVLGPALVAGVLSPIVYLVVGLWLTQNAVAADEPKSATGPTGPTDPTNDDTGPTSTSGR